MLTKRYLTSTKNLQALLKKIVDGAAPERFTNEHLKSIGFASSNDRGFIPLLKDLGFLTAEGAPTARYHSFRDRSRSKAVMAEALRDAYSDVFHIREIPTAADREAIEGVFRTKLNSSDRVAKEQTSTFLALLQEADLSSEVGMSISVPGLNDNTSDPPQNVRVAEEVKAPQNGLVTTQLHYTIQVHLPATKDIEVFNAIFRSLRENLLT